MLKVCERLKAKASEVELVRKLFSDPRWAPVEAPKTRRRQSREERPRHNVTVSRWDCGDEKRSLVNECELDKG